MQFLDLPPEVLISVFKYSGTDLSLVYQEVPILKPLILYATYSQPKVTTSQFKPEDIEYLLNSGICIHPLELVIDDVNENLIQNMLPQILSTGCKISLEIKDSSFIPLIQIFQHNQRVIDVFLSCQEDISSLNIRYLKCLTPNLNLRFPRYLQHLDLSFTALTDLKLSTIVFPKHLKTLDLSNNLLCIINDLVLQVKDLSHLQSINLCNNDITYFNVNLSKCSNLKTLNLCCNLLVDTMLNCFHFGHLEFLGLSRNVIRCLPSYLTTISDLEPELLVS